MLQLERKLKQNLAESAEERLFRTPLRLRTPQQCLSARYGCFLSRCTRETRFKVRKEETPRISADIRFKWRAQRDHDRSEVAPRTRRPPCRRDQRAADHISKRATDSNPSRSALRYRVRMDFEDGGVFNNHSGEATGGTVNRPFPPTPFR